MQQPLPRRLAIGLPIAGVASLLIAWQLIVPWAGVPKYYLPTPVDIIGFLISRWELMWENFLPTLLESVAGFVIGNLVAVLMAIGFVHNRYLQSAYFPVVLFFNTIPILALAPIIILIFGIGIESKVVIASIICFFPTLVNMIRGLESIGRSEQELFRVLSATKVQVLWRLRLPRSLPLLFSSLRIASATAVIGAVVGEWIGTEKGLGALIIEATFNYKSEMLYAALVMSSSLAIIFFAIVVAAERRILRHR